MAIQRILLPTDLSELSVRAARVARELAQIGGATVHVLHVFQTVKVALPGPEVGVLLRKVPPDEAVLQTAVDEFARRYLATAGVSVVTALRRGKPAREIVRYAKAEQIDRIVIGTNARGIVRRILHGSVTNSVLEHAPCAVVMVPPTVPLPGRDEDQRGMVPAVAPAS